MIDLSKISPREAPEKTVKVNILGTVQEQNIKALTGEARLKYWALDFSANAGESTRERVFIALTHGAGMSGENAAKLIALDWGAATGLAGDIHKLTTDFDDSIRAEKENAEKNSNAETAETSTAS